jgi:hypothetical protein
MVVVLIFVRVSLTAVPGLAEERANKRRRKSGEKGESDPQKLVKSVLKTASQKRVWEATTLAVKKAFEQSAKAEDKTAMPLCVHDIVAALYR